MHRDVQSDNEARRRANIGNRQVSSRRAGSITLHCSQNLAVPLPVAVIGNNIIKRHSPRGVQSLPLVKFLPLSTRNEPSRRSQAKADQPPGTWPKPLRPQQILAWTLKSRWQKQNQLLREVAGSFRSEKVTRLHHRSAHAQDIRFTLLSKSRLAR